MEDFSSSGLGGESQQASHLKASRTFANGGDPGRPSVIGLYFATIEGGLQMRIHPPILRVLRLSGQAPGDLPITTWSHHTDKAGDLKSQYVVAWTLLLAIG
jgi:hypothetical protein